MQGLNLRRRDCVLCGAPIKGKGRIDRIYCSASCRTLAWAERAGRRQHRPRTARVLPQPGDYLPRGALTQVAMRLEAELLATRRRVAELEGRSDSPATTEAIDGLDDTLLELAELKAAQAQTERDGADLLHDWVEANQKREASEANNQKLSSEIEELRAQLTKVTEQNRQLRADMEKTRREPTSIRQRMAELDTDHKKVLDAKQARINQLDQENARLQQEIERTRTAWTATSQENQRLAKEQQASAKTHAAQQRDLDANRDENSRLRAELAQLRALSPDKDPLLFLMRTKVNLLHMVALAQEKAGLPISGRRLPDPDPRTVREAAIYAAYEARRDYYAQQSVRKSSGVRWIHEDRLLDPKSEEAVREQQTWAVKRLEQDLRLARQF